MTKLGWSLCAGSAVSALMAMAPCHATDTQTITVSSGSTQTFSNTIGNITTSTGTTLEITGGGTAVLTATNTYSAGTAVISGSTVSVGADENLGVVTGGIGLGDATTTGTLMLTNTIAITSGRAVTLGTLGGTINVAGTAEWTFLGVVSGSGGLTVEGTNTLGLTGTNTYTGGTTVIGGATLQVGDDDALGGFTTNTTGQGTAGTAGITLGDNTTNGILSFDNTKDVTSARSVTLGASGGTIDTGTSSWAFTGSVSGPGPLTVGGTGTLILDNSANAIDGGTFVTGGVLEIGDPSNTGATLSGGSVNITGGALAGDGTIIGSVINTSGVVAPGSGAGGGTLHITGNYTQSSSGTLLIVLNPNQAKSSVLDVTGTANVTGGTVNFHLGGGFYKPGLYTFLVAPTITGRFTTFNTLSVGLSETLTTTVPGCDPGFECYALDLTQNTKLSVSPTIYTALNSSAVDDAQAANDTILNRLTEARTDAEADELHIALSRHHIDGSAPGNSAYGGWFHVGGGYGSTTGDGTAPGYRAVNGGFLAGFDAPISGGVAAGIAFGFDSVRVHEQGTGAKGSIDTPRLAVYGGAWMGPLALDATLGYGLASYSSTRPIPGVSQTATATYNGTEITGALQASLPLHFGRLALTPALGAEYATLFHSAFTEENASINDIIGAHGRSKSLRPYVSATAIGRIDAGNQTAIEPELRVAYSMEALSTARNLFFQPVGDAASFASNGVKPGRGSVSASAGVTVETSRALGYFLDVGVTHSSNFTGESGKAGLRYRF